MSSSTRSSRPIGIDVGGTFTDFVVVTEDGLRVHKEPTSDPQHDAVVTGLDHVPVSDDAPVVHGTTAATNALLEREGARTALVTTQGFADVLAIGRQNRSELYDLQPDPERSRVLIPADRRYEIPERLSADGEVITSLDEEAVRTVGKRLEEKDIESIAVVFLFSYLDASHEKRAAAVLQSMVPDVPVTRSSALLPQHREYERTATTVVNAYVRPEVARYLERLDTALGRRSVRVMQSNGGAIGLDTASTEAARLALSGPAGGVVGALGIARRALDTETPKIMTLDMGGTSTDVALCDGAIPRTTEHTIAGLPLRLPTTDIETVGAGGGSIAWVDAGGSLRVGPESAGAEPGPVCYGRGGTKPTVTDAHLVLGRLHPDYILGGADTLNMAPDAAHAAVAERGRSVDLSPEEAALGIVRVANATMERALRRVSVERGHDPRNYTLVPFGGAGPLHAVALAEALDMQRVLVPPTPGVLSALGLLMADVVYDATRSVLTETDNLADDPSALISASRAATQDVRAVLTEQGEPILDCELEMRYVGQSYELSVSIDTPITSERVLAAVDAFHDAHESRYGHADASEPVEVVALRVRGTVPTSTSTLPQEQKTKAPLEVAELGSRSVWFDPEGPTETAAYDRTKLHHGHELEGPAILHQYDTTVVIPPDWSASIDETQNLWIER